MTVKSLVTIFMALLCLILSGANAQLSADEEAQLRENELYFNEFLKGFRIEDLTPKWYTCLKDQSFLRTEFNYTVAALQEEDPVVFEEMFPTDADQLFNVTQLISYDVKQAWYSCTWMILDQYTWTLDYLVAFSDPETTYSYPVSVMQTMLAQIVYLTQLNVALQSATEAEDNMTFYYLLGRIMRTILIIDPLPID